MKHLYFTLLTIFFFATANAQIVNIPDANFKAKLIALGKDTNADGQIQVTEALAVTFLSVNNASISDMTGIEAFTNLQILRCQYNQLSTLNVQGLTNLTGLKCNNNQLPTLNVQGLTNLGELQCQNNQLTTLNVQGLTNLQYIDSIFNQLSILNVQGLTNLSNLYCNNNQLTTLNVQGLTNLVELRCYNNQLPILNVQGLTNLSTLICNNNQLTTLNVQGLTNLIDLSCSSNQLTALNVQGLTNLIDLSCSSNQLPALNVQGLINLKYFDCSYNLLPTLNVQGLTNLINLYCSSNQLPAINIQGLTNLKNLDCSSNLLPTLNVQGLTNFQNLACSSNFLLTLNVQGLTNLQALYCENNQLTSLFIKNGRNETIVFSGNPNLTYICADDDQITSVQNLATGYGYTNCNVNSYCDFTLGGIFYTINGTNKYDSNNNGCNAFDISFPNLKSNITNGTVSGSIIANTSGGYSIPVQAGTHTITPVIENPTYFTVSPATTTVTFPAAASPFSQNFCIAPNGIHHDLEVVVIPLLPARPGFDATYKIKYKNKGTSSETATLVFNYNDAVLDYVAATLAPTTQNIGSLSWNIGTIAPFQSGEFVVRLNVNSPQETPAVNAGAILNYTATINGLSTDETPIDNTAALNQMVVNSFDPNDKTCLEGNTINPSMIGKYVHYKIRFENTGTFPAQNIVVKDMIDVSKFDISSLQMIDASHSCTTRINGNKVEFIFENINLPFDDANDDGYVVFKIKTKSTLVVGNTISNQANIYFDYNFPIVTNTATSTFQALKNDAFVFENEFVLYPNPAKDLLHIEVKNEIEMTSISIYNMLGQVVLTTTNPSNTIDVSNLKTGNYFIKVTTDKAIATSKFIKE